MRISDWSSDVCSSDLASALLILMVRIAASIGDGPHDAAGFGERLRFEQFAPFARADEVDGVPPARGGRAGVAVAVGRAVAVDLEAQQTLDMTDIGMICQERVTKADLAGPVAFGRTNLDRKAEHSRWQTPRLGQVEAAWPVQRGGYVENGEIGGKASRHEQIAKEVGVMVVHRLTPRPRFRARPPTEGKTTLPGHQTRSRNRK